MPKAAPKALAAEAPAPPPRTASRHLRRNDTEGQVERIMREKIGAYDQVEVQSAVGLQSKLSVMEYITVEVRVQRTTRGHLGTKFWSLFFQEFESVGPASQLRRQARTPAPSRTTSWSSLSRRTTRTLPSAEWSRF